jgi:transcriptional regulator with XRE-family HTH domain
MKASEWIDRVKSAKGLPSDYAVAKLLNVHRNTISNYRQHTPTLDEEMAVKVANALGINPAGVLIDQVAERTKDAITRSTLSRVAGELCILCKQTGAMLLIAACASPKRHRA